MVTKEEFKKAAVLAVQNIIKHGDTDIFPFPFETHAFHDCADKAVQLIIEYNDHFDEYLAKYPPKNISSLTPVTYLGFRWATQLDPIWNAHFLASVIAIGNSIEAARVPQQEQKVFSYRFLPQEDTGDVFDRNVGWMQFMQESLRNSDKYPFTVICDISEFYPRVGHHRLENALRQVAGETHFPQKIISFLSNFTNTNSFGLPIGGPAARLLSEITINQIDLLLKGNRIPFCRFADDYHIFAETREDAYKYLIFLSEKLYLNQGLTLQKSKTRIMSSSEFKSTSPVQENDLLQEIGPPKAAIEHSRNKLLHFSLRFDPYSPTAEKDYEELKAEVRKFDILGMLKEELAKSRVHTALARKIVAAIKYLEGRSQNDAVLSLLENADVLYPIFSAVLVTIDSIYDNLDIKTQDLVMSYIQNLIDKDSHVLKVDIHLCFAVRVLSNKNTPKNQELLQYIFSNRQADFIRRDIILTMARWGEWYWLSDLKNRFRELSTPERRAFIVASYKLKDEGKHWRSHMKNEFDPLQKFMLEWAKDKIEAHQNWSAPL